MENLFEQLKSDNSDEFEKSLNKFVKDFVGAANFDSLDKNDLRSNIWNSLLKNLEKTKKDAVTEKCLIALRILSRDKTNLDNIINEKIINTILKYAELKEKKSTYSTTKICIEAQKLLCNLLFNSVKTQSVITKTQCLETVIDHVKKYNTNTPLEIKLFDVRIIFLITALVPSTRSLVSEKLQGISSLVILLENTSKKCMNYVIQDDDANLACEILKALFNLYIHSNEPSPEETKTNEKLVNTLRLLLLCQNFKQPENLQSNIVNLLTVLPNSCYATMIIPDNQPEKRHKILYQDMDMTEINVLLEFLNLKLDSKSDFTENLSPILTALIRMCKTERSIRKYTRMQVLPPLKDVLKRPEEGNKIRNKLCKLLTTPITKVRDLVAEFLFVLCKEKVGRMIKYTGYGNAAGMFANKGLLGPSQADANYSSESEDSDTEEYEKYKEGINPVIGCYESPRPNPLEGMTEEQKEYEAMKLINLVDQLQKGGIIQPCQIGEDGKPKPIEHVLELQNNPAKQQAFTRDSDSD